MHLQKKGNGLGILFYDDEQVMVVGEEGGGHKPFFYIIWKKECIGRTKIIIDILNIIFGGYGLLHTFNLWHSEKFSLRTIVLCCNITLQRFLPSLEIRFT